MGESVNLAINLIVITNITRHLTSHFKLLKILILDGSVPDLTTQLSDFGILNADHFWDRSIGINYLFWIW